MAGKKHFKQVEKKLAALGYEFDHINNCGLWLYTHPDRPPMSVNVSMNEVSARAIARKLDRDLGVERVINKRNAQAIKDRRATGRDRAKAELAVLDAQRAQIIAEKDALPTGALSGIDRGRRIAIEREVLRIDQERAKWQRLMTEPPAPLQNATRHRS